MSEYLLTGWEPDALLTCLRYRGGVSGSELIRSPGRISRGELGVGERLPEEGGLLEIHLETYPPFLVPCDKGSPGLLNFL